MIPVQHVKRKTRNMPKTENGVLVYFDESKKKLNNDYEKTVI